MGWIEAYHYQTEVGPLFGKGVCLFLVFLSEFINIKELMKLIC
jgi:hypothetical protein